MALARLLDVERELLFDAAGTFRLGAFSLFLLLLTLSIGPSPDLAGAAAEDDKRREAEDWRRRSARFGSSPPE